VTEASKRILVVDDEEDVQILVCRILRDMGYEVDSAADGGQALEKIAAQRPDLVVLDLMMPGVDGWGVPARLRNAPDPPPVVLLTAKADYDTFTRGVKEGASAYVCKPFRFHELLATVQGVLLSSLKRGTAVPEERRSEPRRTLRVEVKVISREKAPIALGSLANLSLSGAQVDLGVPIASGDRVRVAFHVPGGGSPLGLLGRVRWQTPAPEGFAHGLVFEGLTPADERQLRELLRLSF